MSTVEKVFSVAIRLVFVAAFGAFLYASIHHVAAFFHNFEPSDNTDWSGSYALAVSIDGTALILTIGVMFFSKRMRFYSKAFIWFFIILLTGFSWVVNWEYAQAYQGTTFSTLAPFWQTINPILASSFAFLNLAYSIVAEVFNAKEKTKEELQAELDALTGEKAQLLKQIREAQGPSLIEQAKQKALEVKNAAAEVLKKDQDQAQNNTPLESLQQLENATKLLPTEGEDKLVLTLEMLKQNPNITDEKLADLLSLKRPASARFWRLKAVEILQKGGSIFALSAPQTTPDSDENVTPDVSDQEGQITQEIDTGDLTENDQDQRDTDPEVEAVELPQDDSEDSPADEAAQADGTGQTEQQNSSAASQQDSPKKHTTGLLYRQAAKLPICQQKNITAADIRSAVRSKSLRTYSDGSVSKSAVESWAKTFQPASKKVEAESVA